MSNKNRHVVIAYFADAAAAGNAAAELKAWDKATDAVKLGGVGILQWEDGKIKTKKVGQRAAGKGAVWGTALGATLGILSGGVTLIGGALVGAGAGALTGVLFHKGLGLSDEDKSRLEDHLKSGGAAVVAMADEDEVEPTSAELSRLGGTVENFQVPAEHVEQLDNAADAAAAVPEEASEAQPAPAAEAADEAQPTPAAEEPDKQQPG
jgi:uncharacterized membrane protein